MNKKDKTTKTVFDMYQEYPFPNTNYKMDYSLPFQLKNDYIKLFLVHDN